MTKQILNEMATLTTLDEGYGFIYIIHTDDHNPAHIHLYLKPEDVSNENYYTRILIPDFCPKTVLDVKEYEGDKLLNSKEKKKVFKWFLSPSKKFPNINNYIRAYLQWETYQNPTYRKTNI